MSVLADLDRIRELCPDTHQTLVRDWEDVIDAMRQGYVVFAENERGLQRDIDDALGALMDDDLV